MSRREARKLEQRVQIPVIDDAGRKFRVNANRQNNPKQLIIQQEQFLQPT
jgi:hypothetical protein